MILSPRMLVLAEKSIAPHNGEITKHPDNKHLACSRPPREREAEIPLARRIRPDNGALLTFNINRCSACFTKKGTRNRFARSLAKVPKATAAFVETLLSTKISLYRR